MRFLLHPTTQRSTSSGLRNGRLKGQQLAVKTPVLVSKTVGTNVDTTYVQSWGQQCSANCGCVVRFEATLNPKTNEFTSATYHAKSVILTRSSSNNTNNVNFNEDGARQQKLQPALTLRTHRPMFRPCSCESLHKLASRVTEYLPNKNALAIGSSMEFSGMRSSPAFRHTVLEKQGLSTTNTHCFDLVEEALTAMVRGYMPKPREQVTIKEAYAQMASTSNHYEEERDAEEVEEEFRIDVPAFMKPPRPMSALRMLDMNAPYSPFGRNDRDSSDYETTSRYNRKKETPSAARSLDWVAYVDEQILERDMQKSA